MDTTNPEYHLLLNEKDYVDKQIGNTFDLQTRHYAILFTAIPLALGWNFKINEDHHTQFIIFQLILVAASFFMLQVCILYSQAIGYINYKKNVLGPKLQKILQLEENPYQTMGGAAISPAAPAMRIAVFTLLTTHAAGTGALWFHLFLKEWYAKNYRPPTNLWLSMFSGLMIAGSIASMFFILRAINKLRKSSPT